MTVRPDLPHLGELEHSGTMCWRVEDHAWIADSEHVVQALIGRHVVQGLDRRTGAIATIIWVTRTTPAHSHVFIEIEGRQVAVELARSPRLRSAGLPRLHIRSSAEQ